MATELTMHLVRHGESEANLDYGVNKRLADHRIPLSPRGHEQAVQAGMILARCLAGVRRNGSGGRIAVYKSPYLRTGQTWDGLRTGMVAQAEKEGDAERVAEYGRLQAVESIHLRELEFGLFDGIPDDQLAEAFPLEHAHYSKLKRFEGEFYARMPCGESRCDVAQRVHQFFGTLVRDHERHGVTTAIIVSHGVTLRAFAMMWRGLPVSWIENEPNPGNCSIRTIVGQNWHEETEDGYVHRGHKPDRSTRQERREEGEVE